MADRVRAGIVGVDVIGTVLARASRRVAVIA